MNGQIKKQNKDTAKPTKDFAEIFKRRLTVYSVIALIFMLCIILRLYQLSIYKHQMYLTLAATQRGHGQQLLASRGDILVSDLYSEKPYSVATNVNKNMVYIVPSAIGNAAQESKQLATILSLDPATVLAQMTQQTKSYVPIVHGLSDTQSTAVQQAAMPGVYLSPEGTRVYPENNFLSQVLGYVSFTNKSGDKKVGRYGLESFYQDKLVGKDGLLSPAVNGISGLVIGGENYQPAVNGSDLLLTIDRSIQYQVESILQKTVHEHGADSGTVIVADPKTGAILAMANYPDFDPNNYNTVTDQSVFSNSATMGNYEPGSTFKAITMSAGLDSNTVTPQTTYDDTGAVNIDGKVIKNAEGNGNGVQNMTQVIDKSLNTGAIFVENKMGNNIFAQYVKKFGFGQATNIDLAESTGQINNIQPTSPQINFDTASFGQGITVTPIQMVDAYMAIANKGVMMQPYVVDSIINSDGTAQKTQQKEISQPILASTAKEMTDMLIDDVENGFGKQAGVSGYYVAGKTGTAQVSVNGHYLDNDNIGSFIGFAPADDPKFVIAVIINHPRDVKFAEVTAAPAFHDIAAFMLNYYQIPPNRK